MSEHNKDVTTIILSPALSDLITNQGLTIEEINLATAYAKGYIDCFISPAILSVCDVVKQGRLTIKISNYDIEDQNLKDNDYDIYNAVAWLTLNTGDSTSRSAEFFLLKDYFNEQ